MKSLMRKLAGLVAIVMIITSFSFVVISNAASTFDIKEVEITVDGNISDWEDVPVYEATKGMDLLSTGSTDLTVPWQVQMAWDGVDSVYVLGVIDDIAPFTSSITAKNDESFWKEKCFELWFISSKPDDPDFDLRNADYKATALHYAWNINTHFEIPAYKSSGIVSTAATLRPADYKIIDFGQGGLSANSWGVEAKIKLSDDMVRKINGGEPIYFNAGHTAYPTTYEAGPIEYSLLSEGTREYNQVLFWNVNALATCNFEKSVHEYNVKFDANGGNGTMEDQVIGLNKSTVLSTNKFTRDGYIFKGWSEIEDGVVKYSDKAEVMNLVDEDSSITLYAVWDKVVLSIPTIEPKLYNIRFDANGGNGTMDGQTVKDGESITILGNKFARVGYTFAGWSKTTNGVVAYSNNASVASDSDITLYAKWTPNTYSVKFNKNGGKGTMKKQSGFKYDSNKKLSKNKFKKSGYKFKGWAISKKLAKNGKVKYKNAKSVKNLTAKNKGVVTLYAVWK